MLMLITVEPIYNVLGLHFETGILCSPRLHLIYLIKNTLKQLDYGLEFLGTMLI